MKKSPKTILANKLFKLVGQDRIEDAEQLLKNAGYEDAVAQVALTREFVQKMRAWNNRQKAKFNKNRRNHARNRFA